MILPTKHLSPRHSLIGVGGLIVSELSSPATVTALWEKLKRDPAVRTYHRLVLALDLLFAVGMIDYTDGLVRKAEQ